MKPFNLERAIAGDKIVTRSGNEFKFAGYWKDAAPGVRITGWYFSGNAKGALCSRYEDGRCYHDEDNPGDLFMAPKLRTWWYAATPGRCINNACIPPIGTGFFETKEELEQDTKYHPWRSTFKFFTVEIEDEIS